METNNKIALITGGSRGLGKNMVKHLAAKNIDVIFTYHSQEQEAKALVAELEQQGRKAATLQLDTSSVRGFDHFIEQLKSTLREKFNTGRFDFLINNAGTGSYASLEEGTEEQFDQMVNIHLKGVYFLTQKSLPLINDGGRIITLSSGLARFATPGFSIYGAMKGGVETLTRYLAKELGPRQITANTIAPGAIETDFGGGVVRDNSEMNKQIASITALGRVGLPDDIGGVVAFLCGDEARWVNAQRIEVSGGQYI